MFNVKRFLTSGSISIKDHNFLRFFLILILDRAFQLLSQLFTVLIVSNYLGADNFGVFGYAVSLYGVLLTMSNWGLERVLVINIVASPGEKLKNIFYSGLLIKLVL